MRYKFPNGFGCCWCCNSNRVAGAVVAITLLEVNSNHVVGAVVAIALLVLQLQSRCWCSSCNLTAGAVVAIAFVGQGVNGAVVISLLSILLLLLLFLLLPLLMCYCCCCYVCSGCSCFCLIGTTLCCFIANVILHDAGVSITALICFLRFVINEKHLCLSCREQYISLIWFFFHDV